MPRWIVRESSAFKQALAQIGPPEYDWKEIIRGVRWYLERDPEGVGHKTQDLEVFIFMQDTPDGLPDLKIFYLVEPGIVTILAVRAADPSPF